MRNSFARGSRRLGAIAIFGAGIVAACTSDPGPWQGSEPVPPGAMRGELAVYSANYEGKRRELQYFLRQGDQERRLHITGEVGHLTPQSAVNVWATEQANGDLLVSRIETLAGDTTTARQPLVNAPPSRTRTLAFVLVDIGGGVNETVAAMNQRLSGLGATDKSLRQYYIEASFGKQDLNAKVFGPFSYPMTTCDTRGMATALRAMIPEMYDHYLWYFGSRTTTCSWTGLASLGSPERPSRDTWYNDSTNCIVLVQEPGHNFGMKHSSFMRCPNAPFIDQPNMTCTHSEYGDTYDPMGRGCRHTNAYQKAYQGWFGGCNMVEVTQSGTFTLLPTELPCNGAQAIQIPMPKTRPYYRSGGGGSAGETVLSHYYVELRSGLGFDTGLTPQVQLRVSGDIRTSRQNGLNTWILDMNPATTNIDGLVAGGTFSDPAGGIKITVMSLDATKATINVEITGQLLTPSGPPTCMDGMPFMVPGPGPESCAAAPSVPGMMSTVSDGGATSVPIVEAGRPIDAGAPDSGRSDVAGAARDAALAAGGSGGSQGPAAPIGSGGAGGAGTSMMNAGGTTGTGGSGGASSPPAGAKVDASATPAAASNGTTTGGCGCRVGKAEDDRAAGLFSALLGVALLVRSRRRRDTAR